MSISVSTIKLLDEIEPSLRKIFLAIFEEIERQREENVTKKEFNELKDIVKELAEAQKRTEEKVRELAEAQKRTEAELKNLISEHRKTREQVGGLAHTVGYVLEDRAYRGLPELLMKDFRVEITEALKRDYVEIKPGRYEEINIIGRGKIDGRGVWIIGDCKTQLKKRDIDRFLKLLRDLKDISQEDIIIIAVTYQASPQVRKYANSKGIKIYFSYQLPL